MQEQPRRYWFRARRYGFGWTPCTWQGWATVGVWALLFTGLVTGASAAASASDDVVLGLLIVLSVAATLALVWISWRMGEPARWRWGGR